MWSYKLCILNTSKNPMGTASQEVKELWEKQSELFNRHFHFISFLFWRKKLEIPKQKYDRSCFARPRFSWKRAHFVQFLTADVQNKRNLGTIVSEHSYGEMSTNFVVLWSKFEGQFCALPGFAWFLTLLG